MAQSADEKRGYGKGYVAGQKRAAKDEERIAKMRAEAFDVQRQTYRDNYRSVFAAALNGIIIKGTWQMNGKTITTLDEHVELAHRFAKKAIQEMPK